MVRFVLIEGYGDRLYERSTKKGEGWAAYKSFALHSIVIFATGEILSLCLRNEGMVC